MSTCSRSAMSCALRSGRTLKPMTMAFDADASSTSDSLMAPTPGVDDPDLDLFVGQLRQRVGQHFGRALHVGLDDDRQFLHAAFGNLRLQRLEREPRRPSRRAPGSWPAPRGRRRSGAPWRRRRPGTRRRAAAVRSRPSTSTGVDGPAVLVGRPRSSMSARTRPDDRTGDERVADRQRAVLHEHGGYRDRGPCRASTSSTVPDACRFGLALSSRSSLTSRIISSERVEVLPSSSPRPRP